jgi:hypothetical protein
MKVRLTIDIRVSKDTTYHEGSIHHATHMKSGVWMAGLRSRPLEPSEWTLVLDDATIDAEFPPLIS